MLNKALLVTTAVLGLSATSVVAADGQPADVQANWTFLNAVAAAGPDDVWAVGYTLTSHGYRTLAEHWDGSTWSVVPTVDPSTKQDGFEGVAVAGPDDVWAVGWYSGHTLVEHWDGTEWSVVPSPSPGSGGTPVLRAVTVVAPDDVWAVGTQYTYDEELGPETLSEHWDGSSWKVVKTHDPDEFGENYLHSVSASSTDDVWSVGDANFDALVDHWNGTRWKTADVGEPEEAFYSLSGVEAVASDDVWAVGEDYGSRRPFVLHFDGSTWGRAATRVFPHHMVGDLNSVDAVSPTDVWAVGESHDFSGPYPYHVFALHWDGTSWTRVPIHGPIQDHGSVLTSVAAISASDAWAVGYWSHDKDYRPLIEHWDGTAWTRWTG